MRKECGEHGDFREREEQSLACFILFDLLRCVKGACQRERSAESMVTLDRETKVCLVVVDLIYTRRELTRESWLWRAWCEVERKGVDWPP